MFACVHRETASTALPAVAESFAPVFEMSGPGTVVFDIGGLRRLYGSPRDIAEAIAKRAGAGANVAVAANVETAILAARNFSGVTVIHGNDAEALAPLGIETLPLTPEMWETLDSWGIRTLADFANLPPLGIAARLGPEGVQLQDLARGAMERPLRLHQLSVPYRDRIELEHPVELLEPLLFLIARILNDLCARLESQALAASEISVRLDLENKTEHVRTLRLPLPTRDSRSILKLLQLDLEAHPPVAPMLAVSLALEAVQPRRVQRDIFLPPTPEPDKLELTLARIRAFAGEENVGVPELLDTHRPRPFQLAVRPPVAGHEAGRSGRSWSGALQGGVSAAHETASSAAAPRAELKIATRYFRPPIAASVRCDGPRPLRVDALDIHGNVVTAAGPWRTCGDWWTTASEEFAAQRSLGAAPGPVRPGPATNGTSLYRTINSIAFIASRRGNGLSRRSMTEYVELHARSAFSFLEGSSLPEELAARAAQLGYPALAILDRDNVSSAPRFHMAAKKVGIRAHIGAEVTCVDGHRYPLLAESRSGYRNLCRLITRMKMRARKGEGAATLEELEEFSEGLVCLASYAHRDNLDRLVAAYGRGNVYVELQRHYNREQEARNQTLIELARSRNLPLLATNGVSHATIAWTAGAGCPGVRARKSKAGRGRPSARHQ